MGNPYGWVGSALVFLSMWMVGRKNRFGFIVGAVAETFWLIYSVKIGSTELGFMSIVFAGLYLFNFWKWTHGDKNK